MGGVVVPHPAQGTRGGRMCDWVNMVEVGKKEGGFIGPELGKKSPGLSGEFVFGFVNVWWWSVEDAIVLV